MSRTARLFVLPAACAVALAFGSTALAAYDPLLVVGSSRHTLGSPLGGDDALLLGVGQGRNDDATGLITIYAPRRYGVTLGQASGTRIGGFEALVKVGATGDTSEISGEVVVRDPAQYVGNQCSPGPHDAVWLIESTLAGNTLQIPMYVDRLTTGPEAAFASLRIRLCLASPYVPPPQGTIASLIEAVFSVNGVFRNPTTQGRYPWNALFVPYTPGTAALNAGNAAQSTFYTALPLRLSMSVKKITRKKRRLAQITACVTQAGFGVRGVNVHFSSGRSARRKGALRTVRTNARGCATVLVPLRFKVTFFDALVIFIRGRDVTASLGCTPALSVEPGAASARCTSANLAGAFAVLTSRTVRVRR